MRFRSLFIQAASIAALATASAGAQEVRDVAVLPGGALWIALDETPEALTAEVAPGRLEMRFDGWRAAPRTIEPFGEAGFARLTVGEHGMSLSGAFLDAAAELREGGVLITLAPDADSGRASAGESPAVSGRAETAAAPAPDQAASPADRAVQPSREPAPAPPATALETEAQAEPGDAADSSAGPAAGAETGDAGACDAQAAALADAPWDLDRIVDHAECLAEAGERRNAAGLFERVLAFQPEHFRAALGLARLRELDGRYEDAAQLFETAAGSALTDGQALAAQAAARRAREDAQD